MAERFNPSKRRRILAFVREVIRNRLANLPLPVVPLIDELAENGSSFVSIHTRDGQLRGCIGNLVAVGPLGRSLAANAQNAALHDQRFQPVAPEELPNLQIEVSILTPARRIESLDDFIIGTHGIIMDLHGHSAVFLPQVAPGQGWNREQTLSYLSMKAGLAADAWRSPETAFYVFEAEVFGEEE